MSLFSEFRNYRTTEFEVRALMEEHGRAISFNQLHLKLIPVAHANHYKFVDYPYLKEVVLAMVNRNQVERVREIHGYYRYRLKTLPEDAV